jgi:acetylornithine deacetylase/succinyl-diaminopimelate desuccinylase-like protein
MYCSLKNNTFFAQHKIRFIEPFSDATPLDSESYDITIVVVRSIKGQVNFNIYGKGTHTANAHKGVNAIQVLAASLRSTLLIDSSAGRTIRFIEDELGYGFSGGAFGFDRGVDLEKTGRHILNVSTLEVGDGIPIIFRIDNRSRLDVSKRTVDEKVGGAAMRHGFKPTTLMFKNGVKLNQGSEEFESALAVYGRHAGVEDPKPLPVTPVGTYARAFTPKPGTPEASDSGIHGAMVFGPLMPGDPVTEHESNEGMPLDTFQMGTKIYFDLMYALGVDHNDPNVVGLKTIDKALSAETVRAEDLDRLEGMSKGLTLHPKIAEALRTKFEVARRMVVGERK